MPKQYYKILFTCILLYILVSGCVTEEPLETEEVADSFNVSPGTVIHINQIGGDLTVNSHAGDTVEMTAQKKAYFGGREELDKVNIVATEGNRELLIEIEYPIYGTSSVSVDMQLVVPEDSTVKVLETSDNDGYLNLNGE
ncbi:hypothetical protein HWN40_09525 [Methanolobus zinderi]|jgi:hypothetical protein|uniref:Uncharacterized protein n=1 Tax=Methanolobus zinderi TaxID=536044 RepID=A0A7D5E9H4_9EURY|nr:hypothetical protein [Methanolobus zinderi]QLC50457.1 hypothetical protein HWN40_09525 [Methanolobus zinderi]